MRANAPAGAAAALRGMALRTDSRDILSRFAGPVLVVVGKEDIVTPPEKARAMASLVPGATLVELDGAGHLANLEAPGPFNEALGRFLRSVGTAR
jgi:pimeloyl-ACP methyl ester carboxylesterase